MSNGKPIPGPVETREDGHSTFGFGRRACVGKHAANDALFVSVATVLWAMRLERARDESGEEVPLDTETAVDSGMVMYAGVSYLPTPCFRPSTDAFVSSRPVPYRCNAVPRFPEARSLLAEQLELMKERGTADVSEHRSPAASSSI